MVPDIEKHSEGSPYSAIGRLNTEDLISFARVLGAANLNTLLDRRDEIAALKTDQLRHMVDLGRATRAHCGGLDCG
jgi:hypothetical protein